MKKIILSFCLLLTASYSTFAMNQNINEETQHTSTNSDDEDWEKFWGQFKVAVYYGQTEAMLSVIYDVKLKDQFEKFIEKMFAEKEATMSMILQDAEEYQDCEASMEIAPKATARRCMFSVEGLYTQITFGKINGEYKWIDFAWEE